MFTWPTLELTDYEKQFVRTYAENGKPGVLRRAYEVFFNTVAQPLIPGLETVKSSGQVQIARRSRVFALSFSGNLGSWRLQCELATGEQLFPKSNGNDGFPIVSSLLAGSSWNALAAIGDQPYVSGLETPDNVVVSSFIGSETAGPMVIDPNWELQPNEALIFRGEAIDNQLTTQDPMTPPAQKLLSIVVHVWEFPGMDGKDPRTGAGPKIR